MSELEVGVDGIFLLDDIILLSEELESEEEFLFGSDHESPFLDMVNELLMKDNVLGVLLFADSALEAHHGTGLANNVHLFVFVFKL